MGEKLSLQPISEPGRAALLISIVNSWKGRGEVEVGANSSRKPSGYSRSKSEHYSHNYQSVTVGGGIHWESAKKVLNDPR